MDKRAFFGKVTSLFLATILLLSGCAFEADVEAPSSDGTDSISEESQSSTRTDTPDPNRYFYREDAVPVTFTYDMEDPELQELDEKYQISEIAGEGDTLGRAVRLLKWLSKNVNHNGSSGNGISNTPLDLLEYAYGKDQASGINCRCLSIILSAACLSQGIQARPLWLMPYNPNDSDCHVITMAYIPEYSKWVFLDPTYGAYFTDLSGTPLSPIEIRDAIYSDTSIHLNGDAHYNGQILDEQREKSYLNYLNKDMFFFYSLQNTTSNPQEKVERYYLCPVDFNARDWTIKNRLFSYKYFGDGSITEEEAAAKLEESFPESDFIYATPESFWAK